MATVPLKVVPLAKPSQTALEIIDEMRSRVLRGDVRDVAVAVVNQDSSISTAVSADANVFAMLGAIEHLKLRHWRCNVQISE